MDKKTYQKNLLVTSILALLFLVVGANVFVISVFGYHINSKTNIKSQIENIHLVDKTLLAERGRILDRNGSVIAQDKTAFTLYANIDPSRVDGKGNPAHVVDKEEAAREISSVIGESYDKVLSILTQEGVKQVEFGYKGKKLTPEQKEKLEASNIPGIGFRPILIRQYPFKRFASSLIGVSLYDEEAEKLTGRFGLEASFEDYLVGENGYKRYRQDKDGYILPQEEVDEKKPKNGADIRLTIDRTIQESLEMNLEAIAKHEGVKAKELWGAVVEAKTGRVVAWADYPSFDPNILDIKTYENRGSQFTYEPGSTMKTFTVGAAIDQGVYNGDEQFDSGAFYVGVKNNQAFRLPSSHQSIATITNAMNIDYGMMTYDYGFDMSSNVMIAELLTKKLDPEVFHDYLYKLGFFQKVDTDRVPENVGYDLWEWPLEKISNGFGQGSTVTMLQMVQAYTAAVTDGTMVKPYFVEEIYNPDTGEKVYEAERTVVGKPFKESTALQLRDMLRTVVTRGSAQRFDIDEIEVIGKTGTAQMVVDGRYSPTQYIFSSALAFPYSDPEYLVYTAYVARYGHNINYSAQYVNEIVRKVVSTYGLKDHAEDKTIETTKLKKMPQYVNQSLKASTHDLEKRNMQYVSLGDGEMVVAQYPSSGVELLSNERIILDTGSQEIAMPNLKGWSKRQVNALMQMTGLQIEMKGQGFATSQSVAPGEKIKRNTKLSVEFK